jgi:uncharacterized OB-fold protein
MSDPRPEQEYFAHLAQGRFMLQRSRSTGRFIFYPRVAEPVTGATDLEWVPATGRGTVYAATIARPKPPQAPYNVVLVDLEEGVRMMSRVEGVAPEAVKVGMPVQARIVTEGEKPMVVFDPVGARA